MAHTRKMGATRKRYDGRARGTRISCYILSPVRANVNGTLAGLPSLHTEHSNHGCHAVVPVLYTALCWNTLMTASMETTRHAKLVNMAYPSTPPLELNMEGLKAKPGLFTQPSRT